MRHPVFMPLTLTLLLSLGACNTAGGPAVPVATAPADGFVHYATSGAVQCNGRPMSFDGTHTRVEASGDCRSIRVTGEHNDIIVQMMPAGLIAVTGAHNDIWWRPALAGGRPPEFQNTGFSNTLHRDDG